MILTPKLHTDMSAEDYHALDGVSASALKNFGRSPAYCNHRRHEPLKDTPALIFGSYVDAEALTPPAEDRFAVAGRCAATTKKGDRCTNTGHVVVGTEWYCGVRGHAPDHAEPFGGRLMSQADWDRAQAVLDAIQSHPWWQSLEDRQHQAAALWEQDEGLLGKALIDILATRNGKRIVADLKVNRHAVQGEYERKAIQLFHPQQLAWYAHGLANVGLEVEERWIFAVHPEAPHEATAYQMDDALNRWADKVVAARAEQYAECYRANQWPVGADEVLVPLPEWAMSDEVALPDDVNLEDE